MPQTKPHANSNTKKKTVRKRKKTSKLYTIKLQTDDGVKQIGAAANCCWGLTKHIKKICKNYKRNINLNTDTSLALIPSTWTELVTGEWRKKLPAAIAKDPIKMSGIYFGYGDNTMLDIRKHTGECLFNPELNKYKEFFSSHTDHSFIISVGGMCEGYIDGNPDYKYGNSCKGESCRWCSGDPNNRCRRITMPGAGKLDPSDALQIPDTINTARTAALRELREETDYTGVYDNQSWEDAISHLKYNNAPPPFIIENDSLCIFINMIYISEPW
jgi:hypothetical protein